MKLTSKTPYHRRIRNANRKGRTRGAHKGVRRVQTCPDHDPNVGVNKELLEEQIPLVRLIGVRKRAEYTGYAAVVDRGAVRFQVDGFCGLDLRPVTGHEEEAGNEGAEDLREDVVRNFAPWEACSPSGAD
jgi:hypothetical protein